MKNELTNNVIWAGAMIVIALAASAAFRFGYIEQETVTRVSIGAFGLYMAWYGNRLPKTFVADEAARRARRVSAWSTVISGTIYAALFAFAPLQTAIWAGTGAILAGALITVGYSLQQRRAGAR
jgi:hypothetical protein